MENKFYIDIPFKLKDQAKSLGALYDAGSRSWYVKTQEAMESFDKVYLFILYKDKDVVKEMGCAWSKDSKKWWTRAFNKKVINLYQNIEVSRGR
jgi:hypothetical protein